MLIASSWCGCEDIRKILNSALHTVSAQQMFILFPFQDLSHLPLPLPFLSDIYNFMELH